MNVKRIGALALLPMAAIGLSSTLVRGSSHAEAPAIADDPTVDNTDVWAWQDSASTMTILTAWNPLAIPAGGPNYKRFADSDQAIYEIHIDTNADAIEDITYQFQFQNHINSEATFLRVSSPPTYGGPKTCDDPIQKFRQTYSVTRLVGPRRSPTSSTVQAQNAPVAPPNTGNRFTGGRLGGNDAGTGTPAAGKDYESMYVNASSGNSLVSTTEGGKVFAGPRQDAFFVDLGATFDQVTIRTFNNAQFPIPSGATLPDVGQYGGGFNTIAGKNAMVIAIQIPISTLGLGATPAKGTSVGVWSSASRKKVRVLQAGGKGEVDSGKWVQVSRLGNPLVNELFIPFDHKDEWNASEPKDDNAKYKQYFLTPEFTHIENILYLNALNVTAPETNRTDLAGLFSPDTLKVRIDLANFSALNGGNGLKATDPAFLGNTSLGGAAPLGSPLLGRTIADDVVDIYLKAAAGALLGSAFPQGAKFPNIALGDGVDFNGSGVRTMTTFPYMGTPYDGQEVAIDMVQTPRHQ